MTVMTLMENYYLLSSSLFYKDTEIQDLHLEFRYLVSMPKTFRLQLYLHYKVVVESHQESWDVNGPWLGGELMKLVVSMLPMTVSSKRNWQQCLLEH